MSSAVHCSRQVTRNGDRLRLQTLEARHILAADLVAADWLLDINLEIPGVDIEYTTSESNGNLVVFGDFSGTVDFDHGPGVTNLTSSTSPDLFVAKYTPSGSLSAAANIGDGDFRFGRGHLTGGITVDANGAVYLVAGYKGQVGLLGGQTLPAPNQGDEAIFVAKLDSTSQNVLWASEATMGAGEPFSHGEIDARISLSARTVLRCTSVAFLKEEAHQRRQRLHRDHRHHAHVRSQRHDLNGERICHWGYPRGGRQNVPGQSHECHGRRDDYGRSGAI